MDDLQLPIIVNYCLLLGVFIVAVVIFHLVLVSVWPLGPIGWKRVDYLWLAGALLGAIGTLGSARQMVAEGMLTVAESRLDMSASSVSEGVMAGTSGALCRTFVRSEFSPPPEEFERTQREFDELCSWFRAASTRVSEELSRQGPLTLAKLAGSPPPVGADPRFVASLADAVDEYNAALLARENLLAAADRNVMEILLTVFGPYLLIIALALRVTKVTGEIRLHRLKS